MRFNPRQQSELILNHVFNPNQSELALIQTEFSIEINSNNSNLGFIRIVFDWKFALDQSELELIRIDLDWTLGFGLVWIHSDCCLGLIRIGSNRFFTLFHQTSYKTFFGLIRNDSHCLGYRYRNEFLSDTFARVSRKLFLILLI